MSSGIVEFYTYWGKLVEDATYNGVPHRKRIYKMWERLYGAKFRNGCVHITPDEGDMLTKRDGTNATTKDMRNTHIAKMKGKVSVGDIANKYGISTHRVYKIQEKDIDAIRSLI